MGAAKVLLAKVIPDLKEIQLESDTIRELLHIYKPEKNKEDGDGDGQLRPGDIIIPEAGNEVEEDQEMREWGRRFLRAQQGDRPSGILRGIQDLPKVRTPWEQILRTKIMAAVSSRIEDTWMRPSRRYLANFGQIPYEPGTRTKDTPRIVVCIDTSGSIDGALFHRFIAEIHAIMGRTSCHATVIVCDAAVHGIFDLKDNKDKVRTLEFKGGGGTSFIPAIEAAEKLAPLPAILIYLTDLMGSHTDTPPRFPVIWAVPPEYENSTAPYGRVVCLKD